MDKNITITISFVLLITVLTSCNDKDTMEQVVVDNLKVFTDVEYPEVSLANHDSQTELTIKKNFTYALNGSQVELLINGETVNTLDYYYTPDVNSISVADFDFDGYEDIFIPYESPSDYGTYYCYIPAKNSFCENSELNSVGRIMTVNGDDTLIEDRSDDSIKRTIEYKWFNNKLRAVNKTETYISSENGKILTDVYNFDGNGIEYLIGTTENTTQDALSR